MMFMKIVGYVFAPLFCLFTVKLEESEATGYASLYPGKLRDFLIKPLRLFQTHDAPLDEYWYGGYYKDSKFFSKYTQDDYDNKAWLRWLCNVMWLWRNNSYGWADLLGFPQEGAYYTVNQDQDYLWDNGHPNKSYWEFKNKDGQTGFLYQQQIRLYKQWFIEIVLGYKYPWSGSKRAMVASRIPIIKNYPVKEL